jgi:general stress protein YciG
MAAKERGFAAMDQQKQREIARRGGRAAHQRGTAHEFTAEEAATAGRKGGQAVSRDREHMARIGRKGGLATHQRLADRPVPKPSRASSQSLAEAGVAAAGPAMNNTTGDGATPQSSVQHSGNSMDNALPGERQDIARQINRSTDRTSHAKPLHIPEDSGPHDDGHWDRMQLLEEGRMGNENADDEHGKEEPRRFD